MLVLRSCMFVSAVNVCPKNWSLAKFRNSLLNSTVWSNLICMYLNFDYGYKVDPTVSLLVANGTRTVHLNV